MLKSRPFSSLLLVSGIVSAAFACSSGGTSDTGTVALPMGGSAPSAAGTDSGGGTPPASGAGTPSTGGTGSDAGSPATSAGTGGAAGGVAGSTAGGMAGGTTTGGSGGAPAGGSGGAPAGGSGGSGGSSEEGKVMLLDTNQATFNGWYPRNGQMTGANPWTRNSDGTMTVKSGGGDIISKMAFKDVFLHVEYRTPRIDVAPSDPQQRGNSGVYLKGSYEMQVLDTFGFAPANDYCGAIYKISAPLVSACKMAGEWNVYEIEFKANVCNGNTKTANAKFVKVTLNDMLVQDNKEAGMTTQAGLEETCNDRGVLLQDHGTVVPVSFRNIWAIPRK